MLIKYISASLVLALGILYGCSLFSGRQERKIVKTEIDIPFTRHGQVAILSSQNDTIYRGEIEIADTPEKTEQGLMYRNTLEENQGMLFLSDYGFDSFWMKNTRIPLDILFIDNEGRIINIAHGEPYSEESLRAESPADCVLELKGGISQKTGILPGYMVVWDRD